MKQKPKKSICLVTSEESFSNNFGAALQGYALFNILNKYYGDCYVLHYDSLSKNSEVMKKDKTDIFCKLRNLPSFFSRKLYLLRYNEKINLRYKKFLKFQSYITFVDTKRYNLSNINTLENKFDYFVCGSDQIWNPLYKNYHNDPVYFLNLPNSDNSIKIAYAPSIGISEFPSSCLKEFTQFLRNINYLSIREKSGQKIIENILNKEIPVLPDPTLLLSKEEWLQVSSSTFINDDYILLYRFIESDVIDNFVKALSFKTGWKVITIPMYYNKMNKNYNIKIDVGPSEFIDLIKNAKFVCTESFHATVFSIIFSVPFLSFDRKDLKNAKDSRIMNLLNVFNLKQRLYHENSSAEYNQLLQNNDLLLAEPILKNYRNIGFEFLENAFNAKN